MFKLTEKLDLKNRLQTVFTDLFRFRAKTLNPVVNDLIEKFNTAAKLAAPAENKMEQLLAVKQETDERLYQISGKQTDKGMNGMFMVLGGMITLMIPGVVVAGAFALPAVALLGFGLAGAGMGYLGKVFLNSSAANDDREALESRINTDVKKLLKAGPQEAAKSPRFVEAICDAFHSSAYGNETFKELTWRVAPKDDYREDTHAFDHAAAPQPAPVAEAAQAAVAATAPKPATP